ncbi:MAG TPA: alpha-amylase family glycosyl hydrolase, partial [Vicinamibacterales bacterium]|nr:alpha-amylase family glycosyl hydrolase [Vicinamibacterales bacterium]
TAAYAGKQRAVSPAPNQEWARGAVFYEVFVRSFADSNGDGIGDFTGLTAKLDYLTTLGVDGIWLMPVFESPSYHGYDTVDYENIEKDYGTNGDFERFLGEAHKRGIRVILDFVMNHTSSQHPWFSDPAKHDWYVWSATNPGWHQPWGGDYPTWYLKNGAYYYGLFWSEMPDLNYRTPEVKAEMFRLAGTWLGQGVDGFRLDATRYLVETGPGPGQADTAETHQILRDFSAYVRAMRPDAVLIAENTVDTKTLATYYADGVMNFDFPLATAIVEGIKSGTAARIREALLDIEAAYPHDVIDTPFLTNHDHTRIATQLGNDPGKLRNAAAILLTLPGTPFIYYGEEVGLQNGPTSADESKRTPMPWSATGGFTSGTPWEAYAPGLAANNVASETSDPQSLLSYYRTWIGVRKHSLALSKGTLVPLEAGAQVLAFVRQYGGERVLVAHNVAASPMTVTVPLPAAAEALETIYADSGVSNAAYRLTLPPHSSGVWRVR